jgi:hypothetical protein
MKHKQVLATLTGIAAEAVTAFADVVAEKIHVTAGAHSTAWQYNLSSRPKQKYQLYLSYQY